MDLSNSSGTPNKLSLGLKIMIDTGTSQYAANYSWKKNKLFAFLLDLV